MKVILLAFLVFFAPWVNAQYHIQGTLSELAGQPVKLVGYHGLDSYIIDSTVANEKGLFYLKFNKEHTGAAVITTSGNNSFLVILDRENIGIKGENLAQSASLQIVEGKENQLMAEYINGNMAREKALAGWDYLKRVYDSDSSFLNDIEAKNVILKERNQIRRSEERFLNNLDAESYLSWYLPIRKLVNSVPVITQDRIEDIPGALHKFRNINYSDNRLYKSGLLGDVLQSHFFLIENGESSMEAMYTSMKLSIDTILDGLTADESKYNLITEYLFKLLEKRSLYEASEYLALKVLNERSCTINQNLSYQLEHYRAMKIGKIAPDIVFNGDLKPSEGNKILHKLSDIKSKYTVVIFGASWCPACQQEFPQLIEDYAKWKTQGVEIVFISLDDDKKAFTNFSKIFPFTSFCDYQKWEGKAVKDYYVFATPTIYLLDNKNSIILRPNSVAQMDAWVDWYLVKGNKMPGMKD